SSASCRPSCSASCSGSSSEPCCARTGASARSPCASRTRSARRRACRRARRPPSPAPEADPLRAFRASAVEDEQLADLAPERVADRGERREADRLRAVVLEHREVDDRDPDELAQPRERHVACLEELVEAAADPSGVLDLDGGHQTSPSVSRWRRCPIWNAVPIAPSARKPYAVIGSTWKSTPS